LFDPSRWLLCYGARLRRSSILEIADHRQIVGNLAHRVFELWFARSDALTANPEDLDRWATSQVDELVHEQAAILLAEGSSGALLRVRYRIRRALHALRAHLAGAAVTDVSAETRLSGSCTIGALTGTADLIARRPDGGYAIIDCKWSASRLRRDALRSGTHLQLVLYAELLRQQTGTPPAVAYFVIDDALLLAQDSHTFPAAEAIALRDGNAAHGLWTRAVTHWAWRDAQLRNGDVEVANEDIEPTDASTPPPDGLPAVLLPRRFDDFRFLDGWDG
jgi:hypothetical protein